MFDFWYKHTHAPYVFPMSENIWNDSYTSDVDSDGRKLFDDLTLQYSCVGIPQRGTSDRPFNGLILFGKTAFGFDGSGEISDTVHYNVIRDICFDPRSPEVGQKLLDAALSAFPKDERVYAYFHYFGMSACARHGKLHESQSHIAKLLLDNGFIVEHENVYYSRRLNETAPDTGITLHWKDPSPGGCREFAANLDDQEVCWGQVHFLPQGNIAYLRWIFTDGNRQHQGIGTRVMEQLFAELYSMGIRRFDTDTALDNLPAQHYYEKTGFRNEGITRSYYTK